MQSDNGEVNMVDVLRGDRMNDVLAELEAGRVPVRYRPAGGGRVLVVYVKDAGAAAALSDRLAGEGADVVDRAGAVLRAGAGAG